MADLDYRIALTNADVNANTGMLFSASSALELALIFA